MEKRRVRHLKLYAPAILLLLAIASAMPAFSAEIYGGAYNWETLEPAKYSVFSINTTPAQTAVSPSGEYSFYVGPGTYLIRAETFSKGEKSSEDSVEVSVGSAEGEYRIDLILFPSQDLSGEDALGGEVTGFSEIFQTGGQNALASALIPFLLAGAFFLAFLAMRKRVFGHKSAKRSGDGKANPKNYGRKKGALRLSGELGEIVGIVRNSGGRIIQRELRRNLPYSEAKASLLLSELEGRGVVKKYKRGRANLLVLSEEYR